MEYLRKYATATHVYVPLVKRGVVDFAVAADYTYSAGDVKISIDGAATANPGTSPAFVSGTAILDITLSTGEMTGKLITIQIIDSATKAIEDQFVSVATHGHASAQYPFDLSTATVAQTGDNFARLGAPVGASISADIAGVPAANWAVAMIEPTTPPAVTGTMKAAVSWLLALSRNKKTQTSSTLLVRNSADSATIGTSTVSDDGTTATTGTFS